MNETLLSKIYENSIFILTLNVCFRQRITLGLFQQVYGTLEGVFNKTYRRDSSCFFKHLALPNITA